MASLAPPQVGRSVWSLPSNATISALLLLLAALIIRSPRFGDPNIHVDEAFYLQVADLMLEGAVPYVDVWDRKPIGLFLLYAAIRLIGGGGVLGYQIAATLFAFATAVTVTLIARRSCGLVGATAAGLVYLATIPVLGGAGGQSPVFYNLLVAGAALLCLKAAEAPTLRSLTLLGTAAMLLCGIAIQIKYPALVEGGFLGLFLLWRVWLRTGDACQVLVRGALFGLCGIAPTALAILAYAAMGELEAFWFANFTSIMLRPPSASRDVQLRLLYIAIVLGPLVAAVLTTAAQRGAGLLNTMTARFVAGWLAAAVLGFMLIGTFYWHYALPLVAPLAVAAAPLFDRRQAGIVLAALASICPLLWAGYPGVPAAESRAQIEAIVRSVKQNLDGGCLFVFDGPPAIQHQTRACFLTPYVFPYHLNAEVERTGLGVDPEAELRRVLQRKPTVLMSAERPAITPNLQTNRIFYEAVARDYRLVGSYRVGIREYQIHALKPSTTIG